MEARVPIIDGYKKVEGRYPSYDQYLIPFNCSHCHYTWYADETDIEMAELDELSYVDDLIDDSITVCPLCGSEDITRD